MSYASKVEKYGEVQNEKLRLEEKLKHMAKELRVDNKRNEAVAYRLIGKMLIEGAIAGKFDIKVSFILSNLDEITKNVDIRNKIEEMIAKVQSSEEQEFRNDAGNKIVDELDLPPGKEGIDDEITRLLENM